MLPLSALGARMTDTECYHLEGNIARAQQGSQRRGWCDAVIADHRWIALVALPSLLAAAVVWLCGERKQLYVPAWAVVAGLVLAQLAFVTTLRAYRVF